MRRRLIVLALLAGCVAGCAEDDDGPSAADLEQAVTRYVAAVNEADGEAIWGLYTEDCREETSLAEVVANEETAELNFFGDLVDVSVQVDGDEATVDVDTTKGGADLVREWVIDEGEWRTTRCPYA